ncbi:Eukaryotic translation initiation factor 5 [Sesamum alatum]|uniref:Eukaryotic translation initiation factor 5 n=1 Tax=Sesamum alatum TaxID=300844 RepID=A0AAE2CLR5_9LAMI|nr:Eukaryotic translation initiation factor 5 [Sesamum alatum]
MGFFTRYWAFQGLPKSTSANPKSANRRSGLIQRLGLINKKMKLGLVRSVHLLYFQVKFVEVEASFMSEQAILYLGSVGLLGEYCPSRKKNPHTPDSIDCMHLGSFLEQSGFCGCSIAQPFAVTTDQSFHSQKFSKFVVEKKMALQNIGASNSDDAFYRPASYTTKYFGCELGAQSKFDEKTGTSLVNGAHDTAKLAGLLENFIKKYVQCYGCGNPETEILITKNQMIQLKCAACGFVSDVDMRDKLTTFIVKNPPEAKKGSKDKKALRRAEKERLKEGEAADEELKKLKKGSKKKGSSKDGPAKAGSTRKKAGSSDEERKSPPRGQAVEKVEDDEDEDDDIEWQTDTSLEAARQRIQEQLTSVTADMVMLSTDEKEKKAKATSKARDNTKVASSTVENSVAENGKTNQKKLVEEVRENLKKGITANQLQSLLGSLHGSAQEVMNALYEALLDGIEKGFANVVIKKKSYLAAAVAQGEDSQLLLLRAIEEFCGKPNPSAVKEVALVLKALYDADVLEEENIVQWYEEGVAGSNKDSSIWKNAKPFVDWLQSAESESEEE